MNTAEFIAQFEGCAELRADGLIYPYQDVVGVWTQGYGHVVQNKDSVPWTPLEALNVLVADVGYFTDEVLKLSPILEGDDNRLTAITSFAFNLGLGAYKGSTLRACVNAGDWAAAKLQIIKWNHAGGKVIAGLTRRRIAEAALL